MKKKVDTPVTTPATIPGHPNCHFGECDTCHNVACQIYLGFETVPTPENPISRSTMNLTSEGSPKTSKSTTKKRATSSKNTPTEPTPASTSGKRIVRADLGCTEDECNDCHNMCCPIHLGYEW